MSAPETPSGILDDDDPRPSAEERRRDVIKEIAVAAAIVLGSSLVGLIVGAIWCAVAPRVPLYADSSAIYLRNPEGEQSAAADGWFAVLGAAAGLVIGLVAYVLTRRRGGGIAVAVGLALGGLTGGLVAWQLGVALGPTQDIVARAKSVPLGHTFAAPLELHALAALLTWPFLACLALVAATAVFTPRDPQPEPPGVWPAPPAEEH